MICPNCQAEIAEEAKFCTKCGTFLASTPESETAPNTENNTEASSEGQGFSSLSKKKKGVLAGAGSLVAILLVVVIAVSVIAPGGALAIDEENFPDETFRMYVSDNLDADGDKKLSKKEIDAVTSIDLSKNAREAAKVNDLSGIGHFHALRTLNVAHNGLHCLPPDFDQLKHLQVCDLSFNQFDRDIDVSSQHELKVVFVRGNEGSANLYANDGVVIDDQNESADTDQYNEWFPPVTKPAVDPEKKESKKEDPGKTEDGKESDTKTDSEADAKKDKPSDEPESAKASSTSSELLFAAQNDKGKWGYIDEAGNTAIDFSYSDAGSYSDGIAMVKDGSEYSFVKRDGSKANSVTGKSVLPYSEGFAYVATGSGTGGSGLSQGTMIEAPGKFVDKNGSVIADGLQGGGEFHAGYAVAKGSSGWGFINSSGNWESEPEYSAVTNTASVNGRPVAAVCKEGTWRYIDVDTGAPVFDGEFSEASAFDSTGYAIVRFAAGSSDSLFKAEYAEGDAVLTNGRYLPDSASLATVKDEDDFDDDLEAFEDDEDFDFDENDFDEDDFDGDELDDEFDDLDEDEDLFDLDDSDDEAIDDEDVEDDVVNIDDDADADVRDDDADEIDEVSDDEEQQDSQSEVVTDKYVVIDSNGNVCGVIDYSVVGPLYEGRAMVKDSSGTYGFIGTDGSLAIGCNYLAVGRFCNGYAPAQDSSGKWGIIDSSGSWAVNPAYSSMASLGSL